MQQPQLRIIFIKGFLLAALTIAVLETALTNILLTVKGF